MQSYITRFTPFTSFTILVVTFPSTSHFVDCALFTQTIGQAARNVHKRLRQVEYRTQAPDHPILWDAEDSYYLKFYIFQVCDEK